MFTVASTFLKPRYLESPAISNPGYLESPTILNPVISDPPLSQTTVISNPLLHLYLKPRLSQFPCGLKPWLSRISTYLEPQWSQIPCCLNQTLAISNSHLQNPGTLDPTYLKPGYLELLLSRTPAISNPLLSQIPLYLGSPTISNWNSFHWLMFSPTCYCLSRIPVILNNFCFPLRVQDSGSQLFLQYNPAILNAWGKIR